MKQKLFKNLGISIMALFLIFGLGIMTTDAATTPTVSATYPGTGDTVTLNITGDPNTPVYLNYGTASSTTGSASIGTTDSNGHLLATVSSGTYSIAPGSSFTVTANGAQSTSSAWPYTTTTTSTPALTLGQTSISLSPGQTYTIPITGTGTYTVLNNSNSGIASATISGTSLTGTGTTNGTTTITVCQTGSTNSCTPLAISVTGTPTNTTTTTVAPLQITENIMAGQSVGLTLSGGTAPYTISSPTSSAISNAYVSGNTLTLSGVGQGQSAVTVCSASGGCATIGVMVSPATTTTGTTTGTFNGTFTLPLTFGSHNSEVMALQQKLTALGMYSAAVDGNFGPMTAAAVQQYQTSKGLTADGVVGPLTRASLNAQ